MIAKAKRLPRIGVSACFFHSDPERLVFKGKTLLYLEQSMANWIMASGGLPYLIPSENTNSEIKLKDLVSEMDGLVLQGGSDVCPKTYGENPIKPEWKGDYIRDQYELALFREFLSQKKPVLGICRGLQLINVAQGGTLFQDIETQFGRSQNHRDWKIYDKNFHNILIEKRSYLSKMFPGVSKAKVNTVHHQGVKLLGKDLKIQAYSEKDKMIEAVVGTGKTYVLAVQWHPEFQYADDKDHLDGHVIFQDFIDEVRKQL